MSQLPPPLNNDYDGPWPPLPDPNRPPPPPRRRWWQRRWLWVTAGILVALAIIGSFTDPDDAEQVSVTTTPAVTTPATTVPPEPTTTEPPTTTTNAPPPALNETEVAEVLAAARTAAQHFNRGEFVNVLTYVADEAIAECASVSAAAVALAQDARTEKVFYLVDDLKVVDDEPDPGFTARVDITMTYKDPANFSTLTTGWSVRRNALGDWQFSRFFPAIAAVSFCR